MQGLNEPNGCCSRCVGYLSIMLSSSWKSDGNFCYYFVITGMKESSVCNFVREELILLVDKTCIYCATMKYSVKTHGKTSAAW